VSIGPYTRINPAYSVQENKEQLLLRAQMMISKSQQVGSDQWLKDFEVVKRDEILESARLAMHKSEVQVAKMKLGLL
jgi:hypothetical protein